MAGQLEVPIRRGRPDKCTVIALMTCESPQVLQADDLDVEVERHRELPYRSGHPHGRDGKAVTHDGALYVRRAQGWAGIQNPY
jgi:hypothetical protein